METHIPKHHRIIGTVWIKNVCCPDEPVIITTNKRTDGSTNYLAQCACGMWCTTGTLTASEAVREYERMTKEAGV